MCRLFSVIAKDNGFPPDLISRTFTQGLMSAQGRANTDGAGVTFFNHDNVPAYVKSCLTAREFVFTDAYLQVLAAERPFFVGHTRNATGGTRKDGKHITANAHPFYFPPLFGSHNGIFSFSKDVEEGLELEGADIDSAVFFAALAKETKDAQALTTDHVNAALKQMTTASYACLVVDERRPNGIYILRGSNSLGIGKYGPFTFVATDEDDIRAAITFLKLSLLPQKLDYKLDLTKVPFDSFHWLDYDSGELEKIGELEDRWKGRRVYQGGKAGGHFQGGSQYGPYWHGYNDEDDDEDWIPKGRNYSDRNEKEKDRRRGHSLYLLAKSLGVGYYEIMLLLDHAGVEPNKVTTEWCTSLLRLAKNMEIDRETNSRKAVIWNNIRRTLIGGKCANEILTVAEQYNTLFTLFPLLVVFPYTAMAMDKLLHIEEHLEDKWAERRKGRKKGKDAN